MIDVIYRKAQIQDVLRISVLFKQVYIQTYATDGITHEFANFITKKFSRENIEQTIAAGPDSLIVALYKDNPVGIAEVVYESTCRIGNMVAPELSKLYVLDRFCGKGIGHGLLLEAEKAVIAKNHHQLWLEVWINNPNAIAFYERQKYACIGNASFPMEFNTYENKVMRKSFEA